MRHRLFVRAGRFTLLSVALLVASVPVAGDTKPVKVDAKCPKQDDSKFSISVDPFEVVVVQGDAVEWKLYTNNSRNEDIKVSAKDPSHWLYTDTAVQGNKKTIMTEMVETTPGSVYEYQITVYCEEREPVVLDPRVRVGGD